MKPGERYRAKNTMFWRVDEKLKRLGRDRRWVDFHRACGRCGLFFDDIDPINDKPLEDVTDKMRGRGYQAVAFRMSQDRRGNYDQIFVSRGTGQDPVAAVIDAYRRALEAGDSVQAGLESIFDGEEYPQPAVASFNVTDLIG